MPLFDYTCSDCGLTIEAIEKANVLSIADYCHVCDDVKVFVRANVPSVFTFNINGFSEANGYARKDDNE